MMRMFGRRGAQGEVTRCEGVLTGPLLDGATTRQTTAEPTTTATKTRRPSTFRRRVPVCTPSSGPGCRAGGSRLEAVPGGDVLQKAFLPGVARVQQALVHPVGVLLHRLQQPVDQRVRQQVRLE